jgi:NAD(P)-dependent dehydrogenase (short-subunit alcohol dehydrogenase family)
MTSDRPVAIVTGSTSGIGRAIALHLLRAGYGVGLNYANDDTRAAEALEECARVSPEVHLVRADIGTPDGVNSLFDSCRERFHRLDVLVNNAAKVVDRPVLDMSIEDWDSVVNVNMRGPFLCSQRAAHDMTAGGVIINIGASTGIRARKNGINTCASKAGLMLMTQCLALELAPTIRINTVIPGLVVTEETTQRFNLDDPEVRSTRLSNVPLGRLGQPQDVADAVMMLLSDGARFITGQKIVVDGGQNMY